MNSSRDTLRQYICTNIYSIVGAITMVVITIVMLQWGPLIVVSGKGSDGVGLRLKTREHCLFLLCIRFLALL